MTNLYNICSQNDKSQWKNIIKNHFSQVKISRDEEKAILPKLEKFETGKEYLKLRIYPIDYKDQISKSSIFESSTDDYISVVVIDFPSTAKNLTPISAENHYDHKGVHSPGSPFNELKNYLKEN